MRTKPKQTLSALALMCFLTAMVIGCNNNPDSTKVSSDSTKVTTDTIKKVDTTTKKVDTMKMDTAATRPVKTT